MSVNLELYKVFCEVAKYKSISKAAENMYISQSAITQSIQKLEKILGEKVFYRNKNGVELTEEGKKLYEYICNSVEIINNAENIFSQYINLEKGKIRIGGGNSLTASLILNPLISFTNKYPNIEISIVNGLTDKLIQQLANGELDIVILNLPYTSKKYVNVEFTTLRSSNFCFFASKNYLRENPIKNFDEIGKHRLILPKMLSAKRKILNEFCIKNNIILSSNFEVSSSSLMKKLVLNNVGIGFINEKNLVDIQNDIQIIYEIETIKTDEGIATLKKNMCNKSTLELTKEIKKYYK